MSDREQERREKALAWFRERAASGWPMPTLEYAWIAGHDSRDEEVAAKDAEIAALKQNDANREALLDLLLRLRNEYILEIAALREAVRRGEVEVSK